MEDEAARAHGPTKSKSKARGRSGGVSIDVYSKLLLIDTRWTREILYGKAAFWCWSAI